MKLRLPSQLRKALMFCMVSCTVQAAMPEDASGRNGVWYVCPQLERQGMAQPEKAPAEVALESLVDTILTEVPETREPDGTLVSANGMMLYTGGDLCYICPEMKLSNGPDVTNLTGVTFGHTQKGRKKGAVYLSTSAQDRAERAMFKSISVALGLAEDEYEEILYVEHRGKGVVRRSRGYGNWPIGMWGENARLFGFHSDAYHYLRDGYRAVWVGAHQIVYVPAEPKATEKKPDDKTKQNGANGTDTGSGGTSKSVTAFAAPVASAGAPAVSAAPRRMMASAYAPVRVTATAPVVAAGSLNDRNDGHLAVLDGSSLTGNWVLDLGREVELDYSAATAPLAFSNGTLNVTSGNGLTLNLQDNWDGASAGVFGLVSLGANGTLQLNGAAVSEGTDYLPSLGDVAVRYTDAEGNAATLNLKDTDSNLSYALKVQGGTLSLVVTEKAKDVEKTSLAGAGLLKSAVSAPTLSTASALPAAGGSAMVLGAASLTWTAGTEGGLTWSDGGAWNAQTFNNGDNVTFKADSNGVVDDETVTLGGDVTTGTFTVEGMDNYTFDLDDHKLTLGGNATATKATGSLVFKDGTFEILRNPATSKSEKKSYTFTAHSIEFQNVKIVDNAPEINGNTFVINGYGGVFKMVGGTASIVKINANNDSADKDTEVILTKGASLSITRDEDLDNSGLEAAYVKINTGASLSFSGQDSLKVEHIELDGTASGGFSGATLSLMQSMLRANKVGHTVWHDDIDIKLINGATISSARTDGTTLDLTLHSKTAKYSPNLILKLEGSTSYMTGALAISHLKGIELQTPDSYLTIGHGTETGSLNLTNTITASLDFAGSTLAADTDYTFIHAADGSSILVNGAAVEAGTDYLTALKIGTVTVGGTTVTGNADYEVQVVKVGNDLVLRVLDVNRGPSANPYVWSNADGASMAWSNAGWHEQIWNNGSAVRFISDSVEGTAATAVSVKSDVTVSTMEVSGEDGFSFTLGNNTITAETLTKSGEGAMSVTAGTISAQSVSISGGTVELAAGGILSTPSLSLTGGTLDISGSTFTYTPGLAIEGGSVQVHGTGGLVTPSVSITDGGSLSIDKRTLTFTGGITADNGSVTLTNGTQLTTSALTLADGSTFSSTGGTVTVNGTVTISDSSFTMSGNTILTADNLTLTGADSIASFSGTAFTGSGAAAKRHITVNDTVNINAGTFVLGEDTRLTTQTINVRDGARFVLKEGATLYPLTTVTGDLNLSNGAILHSGSAGVRPFAANNIDILGSTVYWTGDWRLQMGSVSTMSFGDDGHGGGSFVTIGTDTVSGSIDLTSASEYSELQLTAANWDPTNARTDYVLFHRSENGSMTIAGNEIAEHTDYIGALKLNTISVITPATETAELERVIENFIGNDQYNTYIVRVGDDLVLRVVDKDHAPKDGGYSWHNNKDGYGDAMDWSVIGWQNEAWFSGSDVNFVSDNTAGTAATTVSVKSEVTAGAVNVSGEDDFTLSTGANKVTATSLSKSGGGTLTVNGTTPLAAETANITGGTVHFTGGTTTGGSGSSLAVDTLNITNGALVLDAGSQISIFTRDAGTLAIHLDGATLTNTGDAALPFRGWDDGNRLVLFSPTGEVSHITGRWKVSSNFILDASAADFIAPIIGGDADLASLLSVNAAGITINLGDKWDGVNTLEERIKLFEVGANGAIKLGATMLTEDRADCLSLLTGLQVAYTGGEGGTADVAQFNDAYFTDLVYEGGSLYLNIVKKGEFVWANTDGAAMTWSKGRWGVVEDSTGIAYREYEHVRFTGVGQELDIANTTVTINGIGNTLSDEDKTQNTLYIGKFTVEGEDNFLFNIHGRLLMTGFEKSGSGTATLECWTDTYRPVFKVLNGTFDVTGGTVDASKAQLELENSSMTIDGTSGEARLVAKFTYSGVDSFNLKNAAVLLTGSGASAEVYKVGVSDSGGKRSSITVEGGAKLTVIPSGSLSAQDLTMRTGGTITLASSANLKSRTYTIESGGVLEINKAGTDALDAFNPYTAYDPVAINLKDGGVLRNTSPSAPLRLNVIKSRASDTNELRYSKLTLTLTGTASVLEGNWNLDASVATVIRFADADTSALSIQNGTLNIVNAANATEDNALTFDLTGVWDGITPITQRLFRTISGGSITMDGNAIAAGDITSQFQNVYVRYGTGADQIINLSSANETAGSGSHYQLLWQNGSLFFSLSGQNEDGPFIWRHSYEQEYAPMVGGVQTGERKLTWAVGEIWRPASDTFGGPSGADLVPAAIYKNGHAVSFVGDTDGVVDDVYVAVGGTVAPGDSTQGEAGIRITGADNYHFTDAHLQKTDAHGAVFTVTDGGATLTVYRFGNETDGFYYSAVDENGNPTGTPYASAAPVYLAAEIGDHHTSNGSTLPTTLSKSGSGTLFIDPGVNLTYSGRTEILEGKMEIDGYAWYPTGIITVANGATLQVGQEAYMGTRRYNILSLGSNMVDNNGFVHTNILLTNGSTVTGEGDWKATYYMMEAGTTFRAGNIELQPVADPSYGRASLVANNTEIFVSGYVDAADQNITLMNRSFMTVSGSQGKTAANAAVEVDDIIISGTGSGLSFSGSGTLRAQSIDLTHGSTLALSKPLEHFEDGKLTLTFGYGATLRNNGRSSIVLNPNANAEFEMIVKAADEPNYFDGNWTVDLSHPFLLDFSYFDNDTTVIPIVIRDGTMTLANANQSLGVGGLSNFVFRADGLKYDTLELMTVGERGKIALSLDNSAGQVLSNNMDYFSHLKSMGYWFHVDAHGNEVGWRYVDLVPYVDPTDGVTYYRGLNGTRYTEEQFAQYTGLTNGLNFKLLYESNTLSLVIAPDGPIGNRQYYFWSGRSDTGADKGPYGTWTRHNSVELSPWCGDDIFQNGYLTIFADVDLEGRRVGAYTVEIQNAVATGSHDLQGVRPGFDKAGIYFGNRSVAGYTLQSEAYHGSGYIADLSEKDITKLTIDGGYVEIKTSNTYGGKLSQSTTASNFGTTVQSAFVNEANCDSVEIRDAEGNVRTVQLSDLGVQDARAAGLVDYSRYAYAYQDATGVHFITRQEYETGAYANKNPERVYIIQRTDGSNAWSVRGATIPMTVKQDLAVVYETDVLYGYAFTELDSQNKTRLHFVSAVDYQAGTYADKNVMEVVLTPTESNRVSWAITGRLNGSDFQESVAQSRLDMDLVQKSTSTYAFAYKPTADSGYHFITEEEYKLWNAWTEAPAANKDACFTAFQTANADLAAFASANPDVLVQEVSVVRTVDSSNPTEIRWTVGGEGGQVVNFQEFPFNQVYAYLLADNSVHVLTKTEQEAWLANPDATAFGHDVKRVGVFGPVNNEWGLYTVNATTGNKERWGVIYERPEVYNSSDAYMRTLEQHSAYAYLTTSEGSSDLNHAHLISEQEYAAWTAWLGINEAENPIAKEEAYRAFAAISPELAAIAAADPSIRPELVKLNRYANEQTYRVTGAAIHDNLSTRGIANNFSYAYTTQGDGGAQEINFLTAGQYKAWQDYNAVLTDASSTAAQKAEAFTAFSAAVGSELATSIRDSAVISPERVDLAYLTQTDNATGTTSNYWAIRGDHITGRKDSLVGEKTYGAAFVCVYKDTSGQYHAISQEDYQNWMDGKTDAISDSAAKLFASTHTGVDAGYIYKDAAENPYTLSQADYQALQAGKYADISASGLLALASTYSGTASGYAYQDADGNYHTLTQADFTAWNEGRFGDMADADARAFAQANANAAPVYSLDGSGDHVGYISQTDYTALQSGDFTTLTASGYQALAATHTGAVSGYAYLDNEGVYHAISNDDYAKWQAGNIADISDTVFKAYANAHSLVNPVVVDMAAESVIHIVNGQPTSDTAWTLTTQDGTTLSFAQVGDMASLSGKVYSYAYTQLDSLGRTHLHFISAEDYANGTYASHNPLLVTLTNTSGAAPTYSWDVRGTTAGSTIDDNVSTRTLANNYVYAYQEDGQVHFISAADYRAGTYSAKNPERVDLTFCSSTDDYGVETTWWQLKGTTIDTTKESMAGIETYGAAFLYARKDAGTGEYTFLTQEEAFALQAENPGALVRMEMTAESRIHVAADGTPSATTDWTLRVPGTDETLTMEEAGGMAAIADKVYAYACRGEDDTLQFITAADYWAGTYADRNPECVSLTMVANTTQPWNVSGGGIDVIVDVSDIPVNAGTDVYTDTKKEHYTYVVIVRDEDGNVSGQFISERDVNDRKFPDNALRLDDGSVNVQRLTLVQQQDGKWFVPEKGYTMALETLEVTVDTENFFGYGYYDVQGRLHLTSQDTYYADNGSQVSGLDGKESPLGNTQLIRLAYDEKTGRWYTPGVLIASNEHALGTSEVKIGFGSRLLATTDLYVTSLTLESGANVIARQNLDINKPLTVTSGSYFETDGTLTVADITVEKGSHFVTNDVKAKNVTIQSGALWDLNSSGQSTLDISDRLIIYGGSELKGNALMRDGMLELFSGDADNPYVTITGSLKLGVDATLDLTKLMPEGADHHYRSPLKVSEGGRLELEPHDGIMLSMAQVNHLLQDHNGEIPQSRHVMHIATLGAGANFYITNTTDLGNGELSSTEVPLPTTNLTDYDGMPTNVQLAEGLGYLLNSTLIRRHIDTGSEAGLDEIVLHLGVKEDAPAYVWDGVYNGRDAADNDNLWCMYNGAADMGLENAGYAWSGKAVYGDPDKVLEEGQYNNWGREVYFLEVGFDKNQKAAFTYHYVNEGDKAASDLSYRAKYVDISGPVWSNKITVDVDRLYDLTLDQYLRNVGYLFYTSDGTGTITDCYVDPATGAMYSTNAMSADMAAQNGYVLQQTNIVKAGTGVLTLSTENSFSGTVYLNSGSVFATNEKALGTSHVKMMDQTGLYINFLFEMKGDSNYRNPVLPNEISVWGGKNFEAAAERAVEGNQIISVTVGYNPISVIDVMCDIRGDGDTSQMREESTSRHWRTLAITGPLHGGKNTEITLQGYTSYTGSTWYTSMFHIYGSEGLSDFAGTIKLQNYRNLSPAAYSGSGSFMDDTNNQRGTGPVELMLSDGSLQYATLDLTRANVLASYTKENGEQGFGRRQTPIHILLLRGDSAVAGLNADFLGTIVRAVRDENDKPHSGQVEILVATQGQELTCVRTVAMGNYTFSLHSEKDEDFVYSGVLGGKYAYAGQGSGTIPEAGEDASGAKISNGMVSVVHTGDGAQYIHTGYLQDLTIGNEAVGTYQKATGGTMGFHYLDLQGNLTLHSGATLKLDVDDCVRTAVQTGDPVAVHWDESAFSSNNVELHPGKHVSVITSTSTPGQVRVYQKPENENEQGEIVTRDGFIPVGSKVVGSVTIDADSHLDFFSRGIEPLAMPEGGSSPDLVKTLTNPNHHTEVGSGLSAPETGYLLDITGQLVLKGEVHVDFAGVEFTSAHNGMTYYLARAQQGIIGTVTQQTISLGNGYYGIVRGLQTYKRDADELILPSGSTADSTLTFVPNAVLSTEGETRLSMDTLTSVSVNLTNKEGTTDYYFDYVRKLTDKTTETGRITLTQITGNIYHYEVGGNSLETTISTNLALGEGHMLANLNLLPLAYGDDAGYIIMTVTNTPPRVWFNTANVIDPTKEITLKDGDNYIGHVMVTPSGTRFYDGRGGSGLAAHNAIDFGDVAVDTLWTAGGPDAHSWIDTHERYGLGCRVQFNKYGTARYLGAGTVELADSNDLLMDNGNTVLTGAGNRYRRGEFTLVYNQDKNEYGMFVPVDTDNGTKEVWRGMVAEMYGEQFDIVELEGDVQARSIFVDCETGIHDDDNGLLVNSPRGGHVNYWFRSAETDDAGRIGDIEVTDVNHKALTANVYDVKIGQVLATTLEKTGSGYLRISTHNSYSGGTYLKAGTIIIDCDDALGKASARQDAGGGDGALHAYDGSTLFLNYSDTKDTSTFSNKINVYANTAALAEHQLEGFTISNGINLNNTTGSVHFVELNGAITAADPDAVVTLCGIIVPENTNTYRDYTSFTVANLADYSGVVRLDSKMSSSAEGQGIADGIVMGGNGQIADYVTRKPQYYRPGSSDPISDAEAATVVHYYDEATRKVYYYLDETGANGVVTRTVLTRKDLFVSTSDSAVTYQEGDPALYTGGEVGLRVTGSTLGAAIVDLSLNSAYHNALVLDMASKTGSAYVLGGVRGLVGGGLTYVSAAQAQANNTTAGWHGYNSNVVSAKNKSGDKTVLSLEVAYGDALYAGTVGYGYYHATEGDNVGLVHPSAAMSIEKTGSSTQSIYSARLDGLTLNQGNIQFVKDLILSGKLSIAKESQLIIGTPGTTTQNFNVANGAPYSIVVQGEGILALGNQHTKDYTTQKGDGSTFTVTTRWSNFTTDVKDFSEDMTPNALFRGGTLTAITDVGTSLTARFENTFTIDTSHYVYEDADRLAEEGISTDLGRGNTHTITLSGRLYGTGIVTVTGGGTLVIDGVKQDIYDTKEKKVTGKMVGYNAFAGTKDMLFRVQDNTTLSLNKDSALAYYGDGYTEQGNRQLVANGSTGYQGSSTVVVADTSRVVINRDVNAWISAAVLEDSGRIEVAGTTDDSPLATISLRRAASRSLEPEPEVSGADAVNPEDSYNVHNVRIQSGPTATETNFIGVLEDRSRNSIYHNAQVDISGNVTSTMSNLTLGSAPVDGQARDNTLVKLKENASLKLENVMVETYSTVQGTKSAGEKGYTGTVDISTAPQVERVMFDNTVVDVVLGENLYKTDTFTFTSANANEYLYDKDNGYYYSDHLLDRKVDQVVYTLTNFKDCVISGGDGSLTLRMSETDYNRLVEEALASSTLMLGIYMEGVAIAFDGAANLVSENLIALETVSATGAVTPRSSVFYVTPNNMAETNHGTVFYIDVPAIPEPATTTLSVLALAALCARRRRRK